MSTSTAAPMRLAGGEWVKGPGGVARWVDYGEVVARVWSLPKLPQHSWTDLHDLRACLTCPARVDEACRSLKSGKRAKAFHAGRLTPRLCKCGAVPERNHRRCRSCLRSGA